MNLSDIARQLELRNLTPEVGEAENVSITGGYVSDLLSDVLANALQGGVLVTIQLHMNVIAVAVNVGLAAIVFASNREPEEVVRRKAAEEGIHLYASPAPAFNVVGELYRLGLRSRRD